MSLLSIVQNVADLVGLPRPSSTSTADVKTRQLVALTRTGGREVAKRHDWRGLIMPGQIVGDGTSTGFDLPPDFDRLVNGDPLWNANALTYPAAGPASSGEWMAVQRMVGTGTVKLFRLLGGQIQVFPALAAGEIMPLEYISADWVLASDGTVRRTTWSHDDDYAAVPEDLLELDLIWRWKRQKGFEYDDERDDFEAALGRAAFADRGRRAIAVGRLGADDGDPQPLIFPDTISV